MTELADIESNPIVVWLARWGWSAIPKGAIPPADLERLPESRRQARAIAEANGRLDRLRALHDTIASMLTESYAAVAFRYAYLVGSIDAVERRMEIFEMLVDAATAYELTGLAPEEVLVDLLARFDVYQGGPIFHEPAPDGSDAQDAPSDG